MLGALKLHFTFTLGRKKRTATPFSTHRAVTSADTVALRSGCDTDCTAKTSTTMLGSGVHSFLLQMHNSSTVTRRQVSVFNHGQIPSITHCVNDNGCDVQHGPIPISPALTEPWSRRYPVATSPIHAPGTGGRLPTIPRGPVPVEQWLARAGTMAPARYLRNSMPTPIPENAMERFPSGFPFRIRPHRRRPE